MPSGALRVPFEPDDFLGYTVVRLADVLQRRIETRLRADLGVTVRQFSALAHLKRDPGLGSGQLARRVLITPQSAGPLLDSLEEAGLVTRRRGPQNGTRMTVALTPAGEHVVKAGYAIAAASHRIDFAALSEAQVADINRALLDVLAALTAPEPASPHGIVAKSF